MQKMRFMVVLSACPKMEVKGMTGISTIPACQVRDVLRFIVDSGAQRKVPLRENVFTCRLRALPAACP